MESNRNRGFVTSIVVFLLFGSTFIAAIVPSNELSSNLLIPAPPGDDPAISWTNVSGQSGLGTWSGNFFSWADFDGDGDQDLLVNGDRLLVNSGAPSYTFTDESSSRGILGGFNTGTWGDVDNDSDLDLALGGSGQDIILYNSGAPNFTFSNAGISMISNSAPTQGMSLRDWNGDGWLDLYVMNGENWNDGNPIYYRDFFYVNDQQGGFTNRSDLITSEQYYGRGISWGDYDRDFDSDLYVGNYRIVPNRFYENRENPTTSTQELWERTSDTNDPSHILEGEIRYYQTQGPYWGHTIGSAFGDMNNDGFPEIMTANLVHLYYDSSDVRGLICDDSHFYTQDPVAGEQWHDFRPNSGIDFKPRGGSGTYQGDELYSGVALGDIDNDGDLDMWLPQIYDLSYAKAELWINNGDFQFTQSSDTKLQVINTYGGTFVDYDNDGDLDLLTGGQDGVGQSNRLHLFRNDGPSGDDNHWLDVDVLSLNGAPEIGASVEIWRDGMPIQYREIAGAEGPSASGAPLRTHFGLGANSSDVDVLVTWPDKSIRWYRNIAVDQVLATQHLGAMGGAVIEPQISIQGNPTSVDEGETVLLNVDTHETVEVWIDAGADGEYEIQIQNWSNSMSPLQISFENQGERTLRLLMFDITDTGTATALKINVNAVAPQSNVTHPEYILPDDFVIFDASNTTDAAWDMNHLEFRWEWDDGFFRDFSSIDTYTRSFSEPGSYNLTMTVRDEQGLTDQFSEEILVAAPIPNGTIFGPSDVSMDTIANFEFQLVSSHPNPENMSYRFDWGDGSVREWTSSPSAAHAWVSLGVRGVNISALNEWGEQVDFVHYVNVTNVLPQISWTALTSSSESGDTALFQVMVSDSSSDSSSLSIQWYIDGVLNSESSSLLQIVMFDVGSHLIEASVIDQHGGMAKVNTTLEVLGQEEAHISIDVLNGFKVNNIIHSTPETVVIWDVSQGGDWEVLELIGLDSDGLVVSGSGIIIDLWSESRQARLTTEYTILPMSLYENQLLEGCEEYSPTIENLPNGAGVTYRWETSFGWVDTTNLTATSGSKPVEVTILFDNKSVILEGMTSTFSRTGQSNTVAQIEEMARDCSTLYRIDGDEWLDKIETQSRLNNLSSGFYNVEWLIEDRGYYNLGGSFTFAVDPEGDQISTENPDSGSNTSGEESGNGVVRVSIIVGSVIALLVLVGVLITAVIFKRANREEA